MIASSLGLSIPFEKTGNPGAPYIFSLDESGRCRWSGLPEGGAAATIGMKAGHYAHRRLGLAELLDTIETARPRAGRGRVCGEGGAAAWARPGPGKARAPAQEPRTVWRPPEFQIPMFRNSRSPIR